jgi:hypothetical protein
MQVIFCYQDPQLLMSFGQTDVEVAHFEIGQASTSGVLKSDLIGDLPENTVHQILQMFGLPAVKTAVVHFHQPIHVFGGEDELIRFEKGEVFSIVQARIADKA